MSSISIKLVVVGDGSIGKTCIMVRYVEGIYKTDYVPTIFDNITKVIKMGGQTINLSLWDTAGQEDYSRLRPIAYPNTDIFLIVFSVVDAKSFINAKKKWFPEIKRQVPTASVLFVGSKMDLRDSSHLQSQPVPRQKLQKNINQQMECGYVECSAFSCQGITEVFDTAIRTVLKSKGFNSTNRSISTSIKNQTIVVQKPIKQPRSCYCTLI